MSNYDDQLAAMDKPMDRAEHIRNRPRQLDDSDRNILAELRHEGCEWHCRDCGRCIQIEDAFSIPDDDPDERLCDEC